MTAVALPEPVSAGRPRSHTPRIAPTGGQGAPRRASRWRASPRAVAAAIIALAATGLLGFAWRHDARTASSFADVRTAAAPPRVQPAGDAYGASGELHVRLAMPGEDVEFSLEVAGDPSRLSYQWHRVADAQLVGEPAPLAGALVRAPDSPGFYRLAVGTADQRVVISGVTLGVMVPFQRKLGQFLNGYRIGYYQGENGGRAREAPEGFLEVRPGDLDIALSSHLRVADFVTHDQQRTWPKYFALSTRLLDKLELVAAQVIRNQGMSGATTIPVEVASGFRTPAHNRGVRSAARDSRHQYGDAADVAMDVNRDGRFTAFDSRAVMLAVEIVERQHPDLAGGLGVYGGRRRAWSPYVHIDARGRRARWRG